MPHYRKNCYCEKKCYYEKPCHSYKEYKCNICDCVKCNCTEKLGRGAYASDGTPIYNGSIPNNGSKAAYMQKYGFGNGTF